MWKKAETWHHPISYFLKSNVQQLNSDKLRKKYEQFYLEVSVVNRKPKHMLYYPLFLLKRWLLSISIIVMGQNTGLQFFALLNLNKANVIFYGLMKPHYMKERKWLEFFNEMIVMFLSYSMLCMTSFLLDDMVIF